MNRKATRFEVVTALCAAIIGGTYVGTIANKNVSQEPVFERYLIIDHVQSTSPILEV